MANYVLEILDGDRAGDTLPVTDPALRIGRKATNDLVLTDEKTSGVHAEVVLEGDRHVLRDLGSTNGTFLDGKRVSEVVLTAGDVVTVGRLRIKFRDEDAAAGDGRDADFAVHRLDASRLGKRRSPLALVGLLVVVAVAAGGWFWWQGEQQQSSDGRQRRQARAPVVVDGNKLAAAAAACDAADGWDLDAHGVGFMPSGRSHTGSGAFEAVPASGDEFANFAVATLAERISVFSGRTLTLQAWVQTVGSARVGVRGVCSSSKADSGSGFRVGTPLQQAASWQRIEVLIGVPPGCDRLDVELVALLPDQEAVAYVDDVAVTEAGDAPVLDHQMEEGGQTVVGTGSALAVRSTEDTMLAIGPGGVPAEYAQLHAAGLCVLSDLGASLEVTPRERSVELKATGVDALQFVFPAESAGQTMARALPGAEFLPVAAQSRRTAAELLLGNALTRVLLHMDEPVMCSGTVGDGLYRVEVASNTVEMLLGFRAERRRALQLLRQAREADAEGRPGEALDTLRELQRTVPQDSGPLGDAGRLRSEILARLDDSIAQLDREFAEAEFFDTRGGFERVRRGIEQLITDYGKNNIEGRERVEELRTAAMAQLEAIDATTHGAMVKRLDDLAKAFRDAGELGLAELVEGYKERHLGADR